VFTKKSRQRFKVLSPILRAIPSAAIALAALLVGNGVAAGPVEDQIRRISTSLQDGTGSSPFPEFEFDAASLLADLYARRDHVPAWHGSRNAEELFTELNRGLGQGFLPGDFNLPLLLSDVSAHRTDLGV
jgi:L,D-transpeptidase YcbB